jgi:hypothetical protein
MSTLFLSLVIADLLGVTVATEPTVDLGLADDYVILCKTGITTVVPSIITGDIAVSPIAATAMTGFTLVLDTNGLYATSTQISGKAYAASYGGATATKLSTAVGDLETAYTDAKGRTNSDAARTNLGGGSLGGGQPGGPTAQLTPGLYTFVSFVTIGGNLHFYGICSIACILLVIFTNPSKS